ncbi:probable inactive poly [ADP-ribose] polymerase SRO2 isoform X3 [Herrania umbratica]|uniref:Probable inactive poly [ADP-ribose] polymerase SRO2 isoform X3 n=1 Tax=Herrania umbratica TaxID=108875 RepID=A0A6J1B1R2_9ROSI|nr:probable inactive poly [ADP-ribose] polymerase SRO2 isoform X3 [Herrania umbratica]
MSQIPVEDQVAMTMNNDEIADATSESNPVDSCSDDFEFFTKIGLTKLQEPSLEHTIIKASFCTGIGDQSELAKKINIVAIHKNSHSSRSREARADSFQVFAKAVADKCGGDANLKYGWYGASRNEICEIVMHGFSWCNTAAGNRYSISLSPAKFAFDSVLSSEADENGLRHVLLCRVILGKQEVLTANSNQFHPTSPEFDSGVDDLSAPRKYIVWSVYMNTHILPSYVISIKTPCLIEGSQGFLEANTIKPNSKWVRFPTLISMLSRFLEPSQIASLNKNYSDFREKKITRKQLIERMKEIAGHQAVAAIVDLFAKKKSLLRGQSLNFQLSIHNFLNKSTWENEGSSSSSSKGEAGAAKGR